ncbi:MAG: MATE family efflux transporter, partial [Eubacteriales bacterium]
MLNAQRETKKRQECFSGTTLLMLIVAGLLTALLFGITEPILHLLGARGDTLGLCAEYAHVIALGAVFQLLATGFVPFIRNMGGATVAMIAMILGFATNIVSDYTFVWVLNQGMAGAAWATIIGQAVTMIVAVIFFLVKKSSLRLPGFRELCSLWKEVLKVSLSPFGLTFSPTITMLLMNRFLLLYGGEQAVAVYGCIGYITSI